MRPRRCGCSGRPGSDDPAGGVRGDHRRLRRRAADRGHAARRRAPPAAERPHAAGRHVPDPGRSPPRAPDPRAPGAHRAAGRGPGAARRHRGLEERPAPLTYRQTERTFGLITDALAKDEPDGLPSATLAGICDDLLEASVPEEFKDASRSLAPVDWTDLETFSRPAPASGGECADPEASWGHRKNNLLRSQDELFFGYYAGIMMAEENGPAVPEFARRMTLSSCCHDPARALVPVLTALPAAGIPLGDVLADSGYAHRVPQHWAAPLRAAGASLVQACTRTTAGPRAPMKAPSSATGTCTARAPPAHCSNSGRWPAPPPKNRPRHTTPRLPSWPVTS